MTLAIADKIKQLQAQIPKAPAISSGKLIRGVGLTLEAVGCQVPVGGRCLVQTSHGQIEAEVVGFSGDVTYLMPTQSVKGIVPGYASYTHLTLPTIDSCVISVFAVSLNNTDSFTPPLV